MIINTKYIKNVTSTLHVGTAVCGMILVTAPISYFSNLLIFSLDS